MICKDGTIVPIYFFNNLFYMPYLIPTGSCDSGGIPPTAAHMVDEGVLLSSCFAADDGSTHGSEEAEVRLATSAIPDKTIVIDSHRSDELARSSGDDARNTIVHQAFGHISHRKLQATTSQVVGMPKYSNSPHWCTACQKGKAGVHPHHKNARLERASAPHDVWHIDLVGKFRSPSLGGNSYVVTIIDNHSRYSTVVPISNKSSSTVLDALKRCIQELAHTPKKVYTDWGSEFAGEFAAFCTQNSIRMEKSCPYRAWQNGLVERCNRALTNVAKTIMQQSNLPTEFWTHAYCTAAYTINLSLIHI